MHRVNVKTDLTGMSFGRWNVLERADDYVSPKGRHCAQWLCECNCEDKTRRVVRGQYLVDGKSESCGCLSRENCSKLGKTNKKYNTYELSDEYGIGYDHKKNEFYFDLEDYDLIKDYCWHVKDNGYVEAYDTNKRRTIKFHRLVMGLPQDCFDIDHIHGELSRNNNRKSNLRIVTRSQNQMNKKMQKNNTSGIVGVSWVKRDKKWLAHITKNGIMYQKLFNNFDDAVLQRQKWEKEYFGEYSYNINNQ